MTLTLASGRTATAARSKVALLCKFLTARGARCEKLKIEIL